MSAGCRNRCRRASAWALPSRPRIASGAGKLEPGTVLGKITTGGKYTGLAPAATNGSQNAAGILWAGVDASAADAPGVVVLRGPAIVSKAALVFDASVDDAAKTAAKHVQLTALGIIPRDAA